MENRYSGWGMVLRVTGWALRIVFTLLLLMLLGVFYLLASFGHTQSLYDITQEQAAVLTQAMGFSQPVRLSSAQISPNFPSGVSLELLFSATEEQALGLQESALGTVEVLDAGQGELKCRSFLSQSSDAALIGLYHQVNSGYRLGINLLFGGMALGVLLGSILSCFFHPLRARASRHEARLSERRTRQRYSNS